MANILKKYTKSGVVTTGTDNVQLDTPTFEIIDVRIDTVNQILTIEVLHEVTQGSLVQKHSRTFEVNFTDLPANIRAQGNAFLMGVENNILSLTQYSGSTEL